jgi:nucleotide-binding universal stress UspA family protein
MNNAILIPTDFSFQARRALRFAVENFGDAPSRFILLNAYANMPGASVPMITLSDILKRRSEEGLQAECDYLSRQLGFSGLDVQKVSCPDSFTEAIHAIVVREKVRMIVMGLSRSDLDHRAITESAKTPLLLIPS